MGCTDLTTTINVLLQAGIHHGSRSGSPGRGGCGSAAAVSNEQAWPVSVLCARSRQQTPTFTLAIDLGHSYTLFKETLAAAAAVTNGCQTSAVNIHLLSALNLHTGLQVGPGAVRSFRQRRFHRIILTQSHPPLYSTEREAP